MPNRTIPHFVVNLDTPQGDRAWFADGEGRLTADAAYPWTDFITALHINLHLPRTWGEFLVGLTGVALFSSLISGILAHPRIFRDAFYLRLGGSRRLQEADLHNRLGVWALPFHVVISLAGALLGLTTLIVGILGMALFQGDVNKVYDLFIASPPIDDSRPAPVIDLVPMFAELETQAPAGRVDLIQLEHPQEAGAAALFQVEREEGKIANTDSYAFNRSGRLYDASRAADNNLGEDILGAMGQVHFGWFGGSMVKIAYGLLGLGLSYLAASGVTIWLARRRDKRNPAPGWERVWTAVVWGQPAALAITALAAVVLGVEAAGAILVAVWLIATLSALIAAAKLSQASLSRSLRLLTAIALTACGAIHMGFRAGSDPIGWIVDFVLIVMAATIWWPARRRHPKSRSTAPPAQEQSA